ncbi:MAG: hypothetical protein SOR40_05775 [Rothia sp. (in: high G+C Gram-positive bacteria)]|nr:hypothetical protein [Rothia sp. (in: high G+C Gram-positive bacteria)]
MDTKKFVSASVTSLLALGLVGGALPNASSAELNVTSSQSVSVEETAYNQFYASVKEKANSGDSGAVADLNKLDSLSAAQKQELGGYLSGTREVPQQTTGNVVIQKNESKEEILNHRGGRWMSPSATATRNVWAAQSFTFAGVKISETKIAGNYVVSNGRITQINSHSCYVTRSYNPMQTISSEKTSAYISNGTVVFECKVSSGYGIPGYGGLSKREAIQYLVANSAGGVIRGGWR